MQWRVLARLLQIQRVWVKYRLDEFVRGTHVHGPLRRLFFFRPGPGCNALSVAPEAQGCASHSRNWARYS